MARAKITRENLKKYRKLYYKKPKRKQAGRWKYALSALLIWQLMIFQLVFTFNLSQVTAADTPLQPSTEASIEASNDHSDMEKDKTDDETATRPDRPERPDRGGSDDSSINSSAKTDETKKPEANDIDMKQADAKSPAENSDVKEKTAEESQKAETSESPAIVEKESAKSENSSEPDEDPEYLWKTCGLSDLFGKIEDKDDRDGCKEKTSCGKIESCLKAVIEIENDAEINNEVETISATGENEIKVDQPLSVSSASLSEIADPPGDATQSETTTENIVASGAIGADIASAAENREEIRDDSERESGAARVREDRNEPAVAETENPPQSASAEIATGDAVAVTNVVNVANTNIIGENGVETVENIYGDYEGDINLLDTFDSLLENAKSANDGNASAFGAMEISIENEADVENDIATSADTGQNEIENVGEAGPPGLGETSDSAITTGDAIAVADVVNIVNTNIIGSNFLFAVINVFGNWVGDLIVPGEGLLDVPASAQAENFSVDVQNDANIENNLETAANSGGNEVESAGNEASIETGGAVADNIVVNQIGTTIIADNWFFLTVNNMGNWMGKVLNWNEQADAYDTVFSFDFDEEEDPGAEGLGSWLKKISIRNEADIENNIETMANTGENEIESEGGAASIKSGNAYAFSKVYNLVNNNFIGSNWMFAVVNIFGTWRGNVNFVNPEIAAPPDGENDTIPSPETAGVQPLQKDGDGPVEKKLNPSLALSRSTSQKDIRAGEIAKHKMVLENTGDSAIRDIVISDKITNKNGGAGEYAWRIEKLDPGKKAVVQYSLLINIGAPSGDYKSKASARGYDENGNEVLSNEAGVKIAVGAAGAGEAAADQELYYYTYNTYYYYRKPAVPVESGLETISAADAAATPPEGQVLGDSLELWNRAPLPEHFNIGWAVLPAFLLFVLRRRDEKSVSK